jgi:hypothetical protein
MLIKERPLMYIKLQFSLTLILSLGRTNSPEKILFSSQGVNFKRYIGVLAVRSILRINGNQRLKISN